MRRYGRTSLFAALAAALTTVALAASDSPSVIGQVREYRVSQGDTLGLVAARFGMEAAVLARDNGIPATARLKPGDTLEIDNRHIPPTGYTDGIVVNLPQRRLFLFRNGSLKVSYPVAVGSGGWRTPTGSFKIIEMEVDPSWEVPKSIQNEMAQQGKRVLTRVPPGPNNPLGTRWIGLTPSVGIHGTNAPSSIFKFSTHGCIRMSPADVEALFEQVKMGDQVSVIYQPLLVARDGDDVFIEAHRDPYGRGGVTRAAVAQALASIGAERYAADPAVDAILKTREGRAVAISN